MSEYYNKLEVMGNQVEQLVDMDKYRKVGDITAIILGSGLGDFAENVIDKQIVRYQEITGFPISTNKAHVGQFVFGFINNKPVIIMQGRIHYYEGYAMKEVVMPIYLLKLLGANKIILTNAAGGIGEHLNKGSLMMITDHITSFISSPLIGENDERFGVRFPDMTHVYDMDMQETIRKAALKNEIDLKEGVYLQTTGPNYETPAEIKAYNVLGADAVGMSTACEAMIANYLGMKVCGISCITNKAAGIENVELDDEEVKEVAAKIAEDFKKLLFDII